MPTQNIENKVAKEAVKLLRIMDVFIRRNDFLTTGLGLDLGSWLLVLDLAFGLALDLDLDLDSELWVLLSMALCRQYSVIGFDVNTTAAARGH